MNRVLPILALAFLFGIPLSGAQAPEQRPVESCNGGGPGTATYVGDDQIFCDPSVPPTRAGIAVTDGTAAEPDGGPTPDTAKLTVSLTPAERPPTRPIDVLFTVSGTATRNVDYSLGFTAGAEANSIRINPPMTFAEFTITPLSDATDPDETVIITLNDTDPEGHRYYLRDDTKPSAQATITNHAPFQVSATATDAAATEGADAGNFTITRNTNTASAMTVLFTLGGDATKGTDYVDPGSSVVIPAGKTSATVAIVTRQDKEMEGTEDVTLTLTSVSPDTTPKHILVSPATIALIDDDVPTVKVRPTATTVIEGASATSSPGFQFERSSSGGELTATYTVSGPAVAGTDYVALTGEVTFEEGQQTHTVPLVTLQDSVAEPVESVTVQIAAGGGAFVAGLPTQATISIVDDDQPTVALAVARENGFEKEGGKVVPAAFNLTRSSSGLAAALTVQVVVGGTASPSSDYTAIPTSVTFPPGKALVVLNVTPVDDALPEAAETVTVTLQPGSYAILSPGSGLVYINDNDGLPAGEDGDAIPASRDNCPSATNQDQLDSDSDSQGDACDADDDADGLTDDQERTHGTSATSADSDRDGLSDPAELSAGTDPLDRFSPDYRARDVTTNVTGRGVTVGWEAPPGSRAERFQVWRASEPTLLAVVPAVPGQVLYTYEDTGFPGGLHTYYVQAKLPGEEDVAFDPAVATGAEPLEADLCEARTQDKDEDGLCDAREQVLGTNLLDPDSDSDGFTDGDEYRDGTDPLAPAGDAEGEGGSNPFGEPLLWLGIGLLALLLAAAVVGTVSFLRRDA